MTGLVLGVDDFAIKKGHTYNISFCIKIKRCTLFIPAYSNQISEVF